MTTELQRGYGAAHKALRRRWALKVDRGEAFCARCGIQIPKAGKGPCPAIHEGRTCGKDHQGWDLGHSDYDRSSWTGAEHRCCNRRTFTHRRQRQEGRFRSRVW
jgi:hypothetical protein